MREVPLNVLFSWHASASVPRQRLLKDCSTDLMVHEIEKLSPLPAVGKTDCFQCLQWAKRTVSVARSGAKEPSPWLMGQRNCSHCPQQAKRNDSIARSGQNGTSRLSAVGQRNRPRGPPGGPKEPSPWTGNRPRGPPVVTESTHFPSQIEHKMPL